MKVFVCLSASEVQSCNDDEPFIPPPCMTPTADTTTTTTTPGDPVTGGLVSVDAVVRGDCTDVVDEEIVVDLLMTDNDELTAEKAAEKMIERRIQVHSSNTGASKSKVDNLYHGSKRSRSLQNRYYNTPLVYWAPANGCRIQAR